MFWAFTLTFRDIAPFGRDVVYAETVILKGKLVKILVQYFHLKLTSYRGLSLKRLVLLDATKEGPFKFSFKRK